jgi:hypothetical protein
MKYPCGFQDVISIEKTDEHFRLLHDTKGRFTLHRITVSRALYVEVTVTGLLPFVLWPCPLNLWVPGSLYHGIVYALFGLTTICVLHIDALFDSSSYHSPQHPYRV